MGAPAAAAAPRGGLPPWRVGGRLPFTLDVAARPDSAGLRVDLFLRLPPSTLAELGRDSNGVAQVEAKVRLRGKGVAGGAIEYTEHLVLATGRSETGYGVVALMSFPVRPGALRARVRLEDLLTRRRGSTNALRVQNAHAEVEGEIVVAAAQAGRLISDIEFAWPDSGAAGSAFERGGRRVTPNPDRLYGLYASRLRANATARGLAGDVRPWRWVARVLDGAGKVVAQHDTTGPPAEALEAVVDLDVSSEPADGYDLEVKAWQEGDPGALARRARFSIAWNADTWSRSGAHLADEAHFLLESEDEEHFMALQPGEQERWLEDYWRRRDPTPETAFNETQDLFRRRVSYANANFTRFGLEQGMFSDMGRVFIRYGEPSEVSREVVPAGDENLVTALMQLRSEEDRPTGVVGRRGDQRPYEIWIYEGENLTPISVDPGADRSIGRRRLVFLFVDDQGLGHFRLRYSTE